MTLMEEIYANGKTSIISLHTSPDRRFGADDGSQKYTASGELAINL